MSASILSFLVLSLFSTSLASQNHLARQRLLQGTEICSCAPPSFAVTLTLDKVCEDDDLVSNAGISETDCTIVGGDDGGVVPITDTLDYSMEEILTGIPWLDNGRKGERETKNEGNGRRRNNTNGDKNRTHGTSRHLLEDVTSEDVEPDFDDNTMQQQVIAQQIIDNRVPAVIKSIQFLEIDIDGNVINANNYFDLNAANGETFTFESTSSTLDTGVAIENQLNLVPVTAVLFLIGENVDGVEVRGRMVWRYTNGCGLDAITILSGDQYAWISFVSILCSSFNRPSDNLVSTSAFQLI